MERHGKLSQLNKQCPYTVWPHMQEYVIVVISPFLAQRHYFPKAGPKKNLLNLTTSIIIKPFFFSIDTWTSVILHFTSFPHMYFLFSVLIIFLSATSFVSPPEWPVVNCLRILLPGSTTVKLMPGMCNALLCWYFSIEMNVMWNPLSLLWQKRHIQEVQSIEQLTKLYPWKS